MTNPFNIQPGDTVELTVAYKVEEPTMNDGSPITLPQGWQRKLIRFVDEGKTAELLYLTDPIIRVRVPTDLIVPVKGTN